MAQIVEMPQLSDTMREGVLRKWRKNEGEKIVPGRAVRRGGDRQGHHGLGGLRRGHSAEEADPRRHHCSRWIADRYPGQPRRRHHGPDRGGQCPGRRRKEGRRHRQAGVRARARRICSASCRRPCGAKPKAPPRPRTPPRRDRAPPRCPRPATVAPRAAAPPGGKILASPLARRLATDLGIDLRLVAGTGPGGRIVERDVKAATQGGATASVSAGAAATAIDWHAAEEAPQTKAAASGAPLPVQLVPDRRTEARPVPPAPTGDVEKPLSLMRKTIARRLLESKTTIPHFYLTAEADMDAAMEFREQVSQVHGTKLSVNDLVLKAVALALRKMPEANASFGEEAITLHARVDIGMAVAIEDGLVTPVIRDADKKTLGQIANEARELAGRARDRKLRPEEMTGGTFSVSNLGMLGITHFSAIINPPEAVILAVGTVRKEAGREGRQDRDRAANVADAVLRPPRRRRRRRRPADAGDRGDPGTPDHARVLTPQRPALGTEPWLVQGSPMTIGGWLHCESEAKPSPAGARTRGELRPDPSWRWSRWEALDCLTGQGQEFLSNVINKIGESGLSGMRAPFQIDLRRYLAEKIPPWNPRLP